MARSRRYLDDILYSEEHRQRLPTLYKHIGHRMDVADRDWTEYCHHCKEPLALIEMVRNVGQNLLDKSTFTTRNLAMRANVPAFLMAWTADRPAAVQAEIDRLSRRIMDLQRSSSITTFHVRQINPLDRAVMIELKPDAYWKNIAIIHRDHHQYCEPAHEDEHPVNRERLQAAKRRGQYWRELPRKLWEK